MTERQVDAFLIFARQSEHWHFQADMPRRRSTRSPQGDTLSFFLSFFLSRVSVTHTSHPHSHRQEGTAVQYPKCITLAGHSVNRGSHSLSSAHLSIHLTSPPPPPRSSL